jgi:hypothetical protein
MCPWQPEFGPEGRHLFLEIVYIFYFGGSSEAAIKGGAQRPVWSGNESKKTGARSARARTRGKNPLVFRYTVNVSVDGHRLLAIIHL